MANINNETLNTQKLTAFFVKEADGGLRQLPYYLVTIDYDDQFYMPVNLCYRDDNSRKIRGILTPPIILDRDQALPINNGRQVGEFAVFEYHG